MDESSSGWSFSRSDWTCLRFPTGRSYSFNPTWQIFRRNVACEAAALTAHRVLLSVRFPQWQVLVSKGLSEAVFLTGHLKSYLQWITWEVSSEQNFCVFNNFFSKITHLLSVTPQSNMNANGKILSAQWQHHCSLVRHSTSMITT